MATLAQARSRWVSENPIGSPGYAIPQSEYDALADDRSALMLHQMNQQEADAARLTLRKKYRAAKAITTTPVGTTAAEVRQAVVQHRTILDGLLDVLKADAIILDDA